MTLIRSIARASSVAVLALSCIVGAASAASEREVVVDLDHARIVRVPEGAQTLVIGNPLIADVTMLKNNKLMVITGKSFGSTNLVVLDQTGGQVGESIITVVNSGGKLVVHRGPHRESYSCRPDCASTVDLGDDNQYLGVVLGKANVYDGASNAKKK